MTAGAVYLDTKDRFVALVRDLDESDLGATVPACPAWTVRDVVAHLAGVSADFTTGNVAGAPGDEWTAAQVAARAGRSLEELVAEWDERAPVLAAMVDEHMRFTPAVIDAVTHEQDVRGAVGRPGARDSDGASWALQRLASFVGRQLTNAGAPALRIVSDDDEWLLGDGVPQVELAVDRFDLLRAGIGRRSEAQVRAWCWSGDPTPYLAHLSVFGLAERDLVE